MITNGQETRRIPAHCASQYDGGIAYMDEQIGKVVDWFKRENVRDNISIIVASDHGESFGDRHRVGHAIRRTRIAACPLLVSPARLNAAWRAAPVSLTDALSVLAATQAPCPGTMQAEIWQARARHVLYAEIFLCPVMQPPEPALHGESYLLLANEVHKLQQ